MQLQELLDRKAKRQKIEELVKFEKIQGILKMVVERRRFRKTLKAFQDSKSSSNSPHTRRSSTVKHQLGYY
ncbi:hypothetical protein H4Q26_009734 [Puccinia striiformis f. sp. tritici PST-130]|nr:hypothetical protein H4Q26_009734 [Puccinia striiformis f. sp. tritici PST-130]